MTTYEEDVVERYYNLKDYFTMKNITFSAIKKRPGGAGRGEIDILAIKVKNNKIEDCVHVEVSVSVSSPFPFKSGKNHPNSDESGKVLKKFLKNDAESKIREIIGNMPYRDIFITSNFNRKIEEILKDRIKHFGGEIKKFKLENNQIKVIVQYGSQQKEIDFIPFSEILKKLHELFEKKEDGQKKFPRPYIKVYSILYNKKWSLNYLPQV